jgi:hypothetical protein
MVQFSFLLLEVKTCFTDTYMYSGVESCAVFVNRQFQKPWLQDFQKPDKVPVPGPTEWYLVKNGTHKVQAPEGLNRPEVDPFPVLCSDTDVVAVILVVEPFQLICFGDLRVGSEVAFQFAAKLTGVIIDQRRCLGWIQLGVFPVAYILVNCVVADLIWMPDQFPSQA